MMIIKQLVLHLPMKYLKKRNFTSIINQVNNKLHLESLNLEFKVTVNDQHLRSKRIQGIIEDMPYQLVTVQDKIYLIFEDTFFLIQPETNKKTIQIEQSLPPFVFQKIIYLFSLTQNRKIKFNHTNPKIIGKLNRQEPILIIIYLNPKNSLNNKKSRSEKLDECDDFLMLQSSLVVQIDNSQHSSKNVVCFMMKKKQYFTFRLKFTPLKMKISKDYQKCNFNNSLMLMNALQKFALYSHQQKSN